MIMIGINPILKFVKIESRSDQTHEIKNRIPVSMRQYII